MSKEESTPEALSEPELAELERRMRACKVSTESAFMVDVPLLRSLIAAARENAKLTRCHAANVTELHRADEMIGQLKARVSELEERLKMADTIAANAISVEMVLDGRKLSAEESYYEVAVRMDRRIEELEGLLRDALPWINITDKRVTVSDNRSVEMRQRIRAALADRATRKEAEGG